MGRWWGIIVAPRGICCTGMQTYCATTPSVGGESVWQDCAHSFEAKLNHKAVFPWLVLDGGALRQAFGGSVVVMLLGKRTHTSSSSCPSFFKTTHSTNKEYGQPGLWPLSIYSKEKVCIFLPEALGLKTVTETISVRLNWFLCPCDRRLARNGFFSSAGDCVHAHVRERSGGEFFPMYHLHGLNTSFLQERCHAKYGNNLCRGK